MSSRAYAFLTGVFILALSAALVGLAVWLGSYSVPRRPYIVVTQGSVSGLNAQSAIYYRGVPAGIVGSIRFDPHNLQNILVRIEVNKDIPITKGTYATLKPRGVTGLSYIELDTNNKYHQPLRTQPNHPARIPMHKSLLGSLKGRSRRILARVDTLTERMNKLLDPQNLKQVNQLLTTTQTAVRRLNGLEVRARKSFGRIPELSRHTENTLDNIDTLTENLGQTSDTVRKTAKQLGDLSGRGQQISHELQTQTLPALNNLLTDLQGTSRHVRHLTNTLAEDPQSLLLGRRPPAPGPGEPGYRKKR